MAEEMGPSLHTYKVQLEQVEAALTSDSTNAELLKLKNDLLEVISLTGNLIDTQGTSSGAGAGLTSEGSSKEPGPTKAWKVGDACMAVWSEDSQWYDAVIDAITDDGLVALTFDGFGNSDVTSLSALKDCVPGEKKGLHRPGFGDGDKSKKKVVEAQRQQAKKRKQRKHDRQKQIEEAHEADKAKWLAFSTKVRFTKKLKGVTKKSIFATPDAANGRVGIGTCGIGGKPMTEYTHAEKWRKGT
ncbi:Survival of motor neuron-related-splicing factor 30 [Chionoecetes opilio]|uniref:Survival of motor neuron-related-splicing factor 30 n=1 Tax=Chionoecetes opilio TaxID=41210 RepID=A0A8J4XZV7_CHIOP|nr:Survival of motor neuron-related-splicing factor 30 [Chionoecetes opilio]